MLASLWVLLRPSLPPLLSAYPVEPGLVDLSGERAGGEPTEKLTLADTIAPHWFSPPEGVVYTTIYTFRGREPVRSNGVSEC